MNKEKAKLRVVVERDQLSTRLEALRRYLYFNAQRELLERQEKIMQDYLDVLNERIKAFDREEDENG